MKIIINGKEQETSQNQNLSALIAHFVSEKRHIVAEVNGNIIKNDNWSATSLNEGDTIELVSFMGGGA